MKYDQFIPSNTVCFKYLVKQYLIIQDKWIGPQALPIYEFNSIQFMTTVCSHVLTLQVQVLQLLTVHVSKCFLFCPVLS